MRQNERMSLKSVANLKYNKNAVKCIFGRLLIKIFYKLHNL